jgi:hypothetical protein
MSPSDDEMAWKRDKSTGYHAVKRPLGAGINVYLSATLVMFHLYINKDKLDDNIPLVPLRMMYFKHYDFWPLKPVKP